MNYETLKNLIKHHCHLYYDKNAPEISDQEFDALYDQLEQVEKAQGWKASDSPTVIVGGSAGKVQHPYKLYSLRKIYEGDDEQKELDSLYDVVSPKIDGANLTLVYKQGVLRLALTRGNGEFGDNVLHLAKHIKNIPTTISSKADQVVINGECVTDNSVKNYRNYVSGALGLKEPKDFENRNILFIAHDFLGIEFSYTKRMDFLSSMGFNTVLDKMAAKYPTDGIVYRINDYNKCKSLGYTSKHPKFAVALKPKGVDIATTTLQDVEWAIGRTGTVNPTGVITPVVIDGATISRVTLHNIGIITEHGLGLGDTIEIERAGGVIPKFLKVLEHSKHGVKITKEHAEKAVAQELVRSGPRLLVKDSANANQSKMLEHFIKTMDIKGLGPSSVAKLNFTHPLDIYANSNWDVLGANGKKVAEEVERSKTKPYETVLAALGIKGVGKTAAKKIVTKLPSFQQLRNIQHTQIKTIGPATVDSVISWLDNNEDWVYTLPLQLTQDLTVTEIAGTVKKVCVTGKLDMTRNQLKDVLESKGFQVVTTVTNDCYALISDGETSSSKYKTAVKKNIQVIDYWKHKKDVLAGNI